MLTTVIGGMMSSAKKTTEAFVTKKHLNTWTYQEIPHFAKIDISIHF